MSHMVVPLEERIVNITIQQQKTEFVVLRPGWLK